MADPLTRRAKKWTYLTWCDLRNHPMMLVGALIGAIAFVVYAVQQNDTSQRIGGVERTVKVPRRCTVAHLPHTPSNVVILFCNPASKAEIASVKRRAAKRRAARTRMRGAAHRTGGQNGGSNPSTAPRSRNGNQGVAPPSPSHQQPPSRPPSSGSPSGGGSAPSPPASSPPARASPSPGVTTPPLGPVPSITVPLPSPSLPLPHLPGS